MLLEYLKEEIGEDIILKAGTNLYHGKIESFDVRNIRPGGYDGIVINDFAQSEEYGNVGHVSYGLFANKDLHIKSIKGITHESERQ